MGIDEVNDLVLDVGSDHCLSLKLKISLQYSAIKLESAALRWNPIFFFRPTDLARNSLFRLKEPFKASLPIKLAGVNTLSCSTNTSPYFSI